METKEILKQLRESRGYSIQDVSEMTEISYSVYQKYESGARGVGVPALSKLADFYGVTTDYLLGRPEAKPPEDPLQVLVQQKNLDALEQVLFERYMQLPENARKEFVKFMQQVSEDAAKRNAAKEQKEDSGYITVSTTLGELEDRMKEDANSKDGA
ncbi:MAG: helix-turn-helix domain-containing protein [Oscillospiraceae bacterium]|nr:helix-turn-helix domain-containing protein [Oscillospiraceae bacterium]